MASLVGAITTLGLAGCSVAAPIFDDDLATTPRPYTETWTALGLHGGPAKRAVSFVKEEVALAELEASDTISVSLTETVIDRNEIATTDTLRVSVTESTASLFNNIPSTDALNIALSETISLLQVGISAKTASDTLSVSVSEAAVLDVTLGVTDTLSVSLTDTAAVVTTSEVKEATDTASVSLTDESLLEIFSGFVDVNATDTLAVTLGTESASVLDVRRIRRIALAITGPRMQIEIN